MQLLDRYIELYNKKIKKGNVVIISAPSGAGKTTVVKRLLKKNPNLKFSISYTTREKKDNEIDKKDYYFVSKKEFFEMVRKKKFVEWAKVYNNYYGTPKKELFDLLNSGNYVLLDIDVKGAKKIKKIFENGIFIFLLPPSYKILKKRIINRKREKVEEIKIRLKNINSELKYIKNYDYIVINDNLNKTVDIINAIILANRYRINLL